MSIHVCKCLHKGKLEYHLRYPGMTEVGAQEIADRINAGALKKKPESTTDLSALENDLIRECERAISQRDEFLKTSVSTAGHGGSHDTCFGFILRKHSFNPVNSQLLAAARNLIKAVEDQHQRPPPLKYSIPYGAVNTLRSSVEAFDKVTPEPKTPVTTVAGSIVLTPEQRLEVKLSDAEYEGIMKQWDFWRKSIAEGDKGSAPRDWFESILDYRFTVSTPAAEWRAKGEQDPHKDVYECERAGLAMGTLSDDALANGAFMNYDVRPSLEAVFAGTPSPIMWMTAVKDRIRWLSRRLADATDKLHARSVAVPPVEEPYSLFFPEPSGVVIGFQDDGQAIVDHPCEGPYKTLEEGDVLYAADAIQDIVKFELGSANVKSTGQVYGIIDPDYGRIYTIIRKVAWDEGYAIGMHGSFTRDLDLIAVPWRDGKGWEPQHMVNRIKEYTGLVDGTGNPHVKPHGRSVWTLMLPGSDPRFVDLSVFCHNSTEIKPKVEPERGGIS